MSICCDQQRLVCRNEINDDNKKTHVIIAGLRDHSLKLLEPQQLLRVERLPTCHKLVMSVTWCDTFSGGDRVCP